MRDKLIRYLYGGPQTNRSNTPDWSAMMEVKDLHDEHEAKMDAKYGAGKWHCDDLWEAKTLPACAHDYLDAARAPAAEFRKPPPLFATHNGTRVRVVMASRFGDVGITTDLKAVRGYDQRVLMPDLTDFSATP